MNKVPTAMMQNSPTSPLIIHSHIHKRHTGVTSSVQQLLGSLRKCECELYTYGASLCDDVEVLTLWRLLKLVRSRRCVVWHAHRNIEVIVAKIVQLFKPAMKIVSTRHSATYPSWITRLLLNSSDKVVALTKATLGLLPEHSTVIPHGINVDEFTYSAAHLPANIGIDAKYLVGVIGRVREEKAQHVVIQAMGPLLRDNPDWMLVILGRVKRRDNKYFQSLTYLIDKENIKQRVCFIDEVHDPIPYYQAISVLTVPSLSEGFSMVTLEGMSCGCEVIATKGVGIHDELISHGNTGWLVEPGNVEAMRKQLLETMKRVEGGTSLGSVASHAIQQNWTTNIEAERTLKLYQSLFD